MKICQPLSAYVKSVPPVDNEIEGRNVKPLGRVLIGAGMLDILAAESIDHDGPRPKAVMSAVDASYGKYIANTNDCHLCHGPEFSWW